MQKIHVSLVNEVVDLQSLNNTITIDVHDGVLSITTMKETLVVGQVAYSRISIPLHRVVSWTEDW